MENLSSAPNNDLLNTVEVGADFTLASITGMLCSKVFGGVPDVSNPWFFAVVYNLAYATKQQFALSRDSRRQFEGTGSYGELVAFLSRTLILKFSNIILLCGYPWVRS